MSKFTKFIPSISAAFIERVLDLAVEIQQIPAPTFAERVRAEFVRQQFVDAGLIDVEIDGLFNVFARRPGSSGQPILVSAHLDTVFPMDTDLSVSREAGRIAGPGIGDNSLAVAGLIGLAWYLDENKLTLPGDIWFVANVCEEGLGDLKGMRAVMDRLGETVAASIVLEGQLLGRLNFHGVGSRRYRLTAKAPGGHSWADFGQSSAIHTLVRLANQLTQLQVPAQPKTTFNIGVIEGGTSINTIAETAGLQLDLRSESPAELKKLVGQVETLVASFEAGDIALTLEIIGDRPAGHLPHDHPLAGLAYKVLQDVGVTDIVAETGSTDANIPLSRGYPAVCIGLTTGGNVHRLSEYIDVAPFRRGFDQMVRLTVETSYLFR